MVVYLCRSRPLFEFIRTMSILLDGKDNYAFCRKTNALMHVQGLLVSNMQIVVCVVVVYLVSWVHPMLNYVLLVPIHHR